MTAEKLGQRMHNDIRAVFKRANEIRACHGIIDDQRQSSAVCDIGNGGDIDEGAARIGKAFDEDCPGAIIDLIFEACRFGRVRPANLPAEILESMTELVDGAAVELAGGNEIVTGLKKRVEHQHLSRMAGCDGKGCRAAFQCRNAFFEYGLGGVHDARIDIAEFLQPEQSSSMVGIPEGISRRLIDRRSAGTRCRIGLCTRVYGKRGETGIAARHNVSSN